LRCRAKNVLAALPKVAGGLQNGDPDLGGCSNPGLRFQTFLGFPAKWTFKDHRGDHKAEVWRHLRDDCQQAWEQGLSDLRGHLDARRERLLTALDRLWADRRCVWHRRGTVVWRLAVGLGTEHPLENGCTLHRVYGVPYLPGSSIKGLTRNCALDLICDRFDIPRVSDPELLEKIRKANPNRLTPRQAAARILSLPDSRDPEGLKKAVKNLLERLPVNGRVPGLPEEVTEAAEKMSNRRDEEWTEWHRTNADFRRVFGSLEARGEIRFLDALPTDLHLCLDVLTPHYSEYYTGAADTPPADYLTPKPALFLTLGQGSRLSFILHGPDPLPVKKAAGWLQEALREYGAGAKTSAGYGEIVFHTSRGRG